MTDSQAIDLLDRLKIYFDEYGSGLPSPEEATVTDVARDLLNSLAPEQRKLTVRLNNYSVLIPDHGRGECEGHPAGPFDPMGETVYCDGSCKCP